MLVLFACATPDPSPAIVLVSFDTLRADHLGAYGDGRGLTPNLDAFAARAVVFEDAWSQANYTMGSHAAVFTGRHASEVVAVRGAARFESKSDTLAGVLGLYGYATAAFTGGSMLDPCQGLDAGFASFTSPSCTDGRGFYQSMRPAWSWLSAQTGPAFLFVHGYDAHMPTLKPTPWGLAWASPSAPGRPTPEQLAETRRIWGEWLQTDEGDVGVRDRLRPWDEAARRIAAQNFASGAARGIRLDATDHGNIRGAYAGAVAYADAWFGWFMGQLEASGRLATTTVVVMSDHGESLGEDGRYGHSHSLADPVLKVPLMIAGPGLAPARIDEPVALFDLFPTLLERAGATVPAGIAARSLLPVIQGGPGRELILAESVEEGTALLAGPERLYFTGAEPGSPWQPALLAGAPLDSPAFAGSTADLARRGQLRDQLVALERGLYPVDGAATVDPAVVEGLRKQGYWDHL